MVPRLSYLVQPRACPLDQSLQGRQPHHCTLSNCLCGVVPRSLCYGIGAESFAPPTHSPTHLPAPTPRLPIRPPIHSHPSHSPAVYPCQHCPPTHPAIWALVHTVSPRCPSTPPLTSRPRPCPSMHC